MKHVPDPTPAPTHDNGFGALRLAFACLVLVSHAPEMIDGDRSREILTRAFGSLSFGEVAVDGFFLISGALITASWQNARSWRDYLWRRVIRIYPGFLVAFALCVLVVAPLGGGSWPDAGGTWLLACVQAASLGLPRLGEVFPGQPYAELNGAMWTIRAEFLCYLMLGGIGALGLLRRRWMVPILALCAMALMIRHQVLADLWVATHPVPVPPLSAAVPASRPTFDPGEALAALKAARPNWRLVMLFLAGSSFHLWADRIPWRRSWALIALAGLIGALCLPPLWAETGLTLCGGYLIFWAARAAGGTVWARINARNDISYGVYLYGFPIQKLVWWHWPAAPLPLAFALTLALALGMGWASWLCIERPALRWGRRLGRAPQ